MKYIVLKTQLAGVEQKVPIIFPNFLVHKDVARYITGMLIREHKRDKEITVASAGEVSMVHLSCFGKSETTKAESDPDDADLIEFFEYTQGLSDSISPKALEVLELAKKRRRER